MFIEIFDIVNRPRLVNINQIVFCKPHQENDKQKGSIEICLSTGESIEACDITYIEFKTKLYKGL